MPVGLVLLNLIFDLWLVVVLATGRMPYSGWPLRGPKSIDRRENPYFYWFFTALLLAICFYLTGRLAQETIPGFLMPAFLH
jgi:hypothetical protein